MKHGHEVYLRKRPIKPFERLLLKMGGSQIMKELVNKEVRAEQVSFIYEWVDPDRGAFNNYIGEFLIARTKSSFEKIYEEEQ